MKYILGKQTFYCSDWWNNLTKHKEDSIKKNMLRFLNLPEIDLDPILKQLDVKFGIEYIKKLDELCCQNFMVVVFYLEMANKNVYVAWCLSVPKQWWGHIAEDTEDIR
jgi:hypothetical protein